MDPRKPMGLIMESETMRRTYTISEAGRLLGIGRNQAYEAAKAGEIPVIRVGKRLLVPKAALDRLLAGEAAA
jgi:excisionase family DNA binding protein